MSGENRGAVHTVMSVVAMICLSFGAAACRAQEKSDDVKALLKERRELLGEVATDMISNLVKLDLTFSEVAQAERDSFKADLDYFDKPEERIRAIEQHKKAADNLLLRAKQLVASARGLTFNVSQAKAYVLEVQIEVLKENKRQGK
jgi:hypothetical protein